MRAQRSERKRADLLEIAREQFILNGYRVVTMDAIALAAGISKRTLYLWHTDKAALFRACIVEGAGRFPLPVFTEGIPVAAALKVFVKSLIEEFSTPSSLGMGALLMREHHEFPELLLAAERSRDLYLVRPLAAWLAARGLEQDDSTDRTRLLLSMALMPVHEHLLLGLALPEGPTIDRHAALAVAVFLDGSEMERTPSGGASAPEPHSHRCA